jgi:hypothetical protein
VLNLDEEDEDAENKGDDTEDHENKLESLPNQVEFPDTSFQLNVVSDLKLKSQSKLLFRQ